MYIRTKQWQGNTYYQVVETHRDGANVRQTIVASLGRHPTVAEALTAAKRVCNGLRRQRGVWPATIDPATLGKTLAARLARLDVRIAKADARIKLLTTINDKMKAATKPRSAKRKTVED